jgi:prepilin-type N-terminal cleavage/methylation domain-containing protein
MQKKYLKKNYIESKKGFSLIEMMVVVGIIGLIVLGLVTFFTGGAKSWIAGQSQLTAQRNARQAMDIMVREIREASEVTTKNDTKIIFDTPWVSGITYELVSDTINRNNIPLINNVSNLDFDYPSLSKVHILLEVDVDDDGNPDITLNTDVNLRNYGL